MQYHILAVGDVVGEPGLRHLEKNLRPLQKFKQVHFTVVNGENAAGVGLMPEQAERIRDAGADAVTLPTTPLERCRSRPFWRTLPGCCGLPTTPAGCRATAAKSLIWALSGCG